MKTPAVAVRIKALKVFPGFHDLPPEYLVALGAYAEVKTYSAGSVLQAAGEPREHVHIVLEGETERVRAGKVVERVGAYDLVGGAASLADGEATCTVRAATELQVLSLRCEAARWLIVDNQAVFAAVLGSLAERVLRLRDAAGPSRGFPQVEPTEEVAEISMAEKLLALVECEATRELPIDVLGAVAMGSTLLDVAQGQPLVTGEDRVVAARFPVHGVMRCVDEDCAAAVGRGHALGLEEMLAHRPLRCTFVAETASALVEVSLDALLDDIEDDDEACMALLLGISRTAQRLEDQLLL